MARWHRLSIPAPPQWNAARPAGSSCFLDDDAEHRRTANNTLPVELQTMVRAAPRLSVLTIRPTNVLERTEVGNPQGEVYLTHTSCIASSTAKRQSNCKDKFSSKPTGVHSTQSQERLATHDSRLAPGSNVSTCKISCWSWTREVSSVQNRNSMHNCICCSSYWTAWGSVQHGVLLAEEQMEAPGLVDE